MIKQIPEAEKGCICCHSLLLPFSSNAHLRRFLASAPNNLHSIVSWAKDKAKFTIALVVIIELALPIWLIIRFLAFGSVLSLVIYAAKDHSMYSNLREYNWTSIMT